MQGRRRGFSLIELMIVVGIMGVLMALAAPSFSIYLRNVKLRAAADTFLASVQMARIEAVRMNSPVEFLLTTATPLPANVATATVASASLDQSAQSLNWMIRTADLATFIDGKFSAEGSGRAIGQVSPIRINDRSAPAVSDPDAPPATPTMSITFDSLGRAGLAAPAIFKFTDADAGTCQTAGGTVRCLKVIVAVGGRARLCDPAVGATAVAAGDSRGC